MIKLGLLLLLGISQVLAGPTKVTNRQQSQDASDAKDLSNEPRSMMGYQIRFSISSFDLSDPGKPLGPKDFFLASQLPKIPPNITTEMMMKVHAT